MSAAENGGGTPEEWAALDFEPAFYGPQLWMPPKNPAWCEETIVPTRIAFALVFMSKGELIEAFKNEPEAFLDAADWMQAALSAMKSANGLLNSARARILIAGSAAGF